MKTLQDIKDEYAQEQGYDDWNELRRELYGDVPKLRIEDHMDEVCLLAQKAALRKAAENAITDFDFQLDWHSINKESITNENNLIR